MCNTVLQREYPQDAASAEQLRKRSFVQDSAASTPDQCCSALSLLGGDTGASPVLTRFYVPLLLKPLHRKEARRRLRIIAAPVVELGGAGLAVSGTLASCRRNRAGQSLRSCSQNFSSVVMHWASHFF